MPQLANLRLLFSSPPLPSLLINPLFRLPSSSLFSSPSTPLRPNSALTVLSYSGRRGRKVGGRGGRVLHQRRGNSTLREDKGGGRVLPQRRGNSTLREDKGGGDRNPEMEAKEGAGGFNRKRAEGRDKPSMPKTLQLKNRKLNPVSTICYVQILGTGMDTQDTSPSVLLFFDRRRFIFNAGEGLQRFCTEHKIKLSKIDHMFLTRVCSETAGGLPGLLLTLAGMGEEGMSVNIWGPSDLKYFVDAMRSFIPNAAMVHTHSFGLTQNSDGAALSRSEPGNFTDPIVLIDDEVVRISAIPLRPIYCRDLEGAINIYNNSNLTSSHREERGSQFPDPFDSCLQDKTGPALKPGDIAVIYACELPEIRGKFDPRKAAALGLKPGPKYRELQLGNSVMSDNLNKMVHPSDVLGPSSPGPIVLLVDCPTPSHMMELLSLRSLSCYYMGSVDHTRGGIKVVNCVIHLGPSSVTKNADYQKWMKRFGNAQHIMAGHEIKNVEIPILKSSARISSRLNYLCPQLFPAPGFSSAQHADNFPPEFNLSHEDLSLSLCDGISAENLLKFHLRPYTQLGLDRSAIPHLFNHTDTIDELLAEIPEIADVSKHISQFWLSPLEGKFIPPKEESIGMVEEPWINEISCIPFGNMIKVSTDACKEDIPSVNGVRKEDVKHNSDIPPCLENITREDMEIVLLGTGSSQPSKYRNVSSIFVNLFSKGSLLLDCGEGTLGQLKRRFGVKGADDAVKGLKCIWISHIHADHHTGLARILALRSQLLKDLPHEPLLVVGPRPLKRFLDAYSRLEDLDMQFLDCRHTTEASLDALLSSHESSKDCSPEHIDKEDSRDGGFEAVTSQHLETNLFAQGSRMQSYWKRLGSPIDTAMALPVLMRLKEVLCEAGLEALYSVPVIHCPQAFGVVLKASERINSVGKSIPGWKLVYSGDTRPCQSLIDASRDATVLIHEATFEDSMEDEAIARNHSTTMEAISVGASAGTYRIILTHFSQRYPKIPVFDEAHMHRTCIGFDMMSVNVADLPVLPMVLPYLKVLFRNEMVVDESDDVLESDFHQ